jgi:uncharacterized protein YkwD
MSSGSRVLWLVFGVIAAAAGLLWLGSWIAVWQWEQQVAAVVPARVVALANAERQASALLPLAANPVLAAAAQAKAEDMAAREYFAHQSPEGWEPWVWLERAGYAYLSAGENLAVNFYQSQTVVEAWLASPRHRDNILRPDFTEMGLGVATGRYRGAPAVFIVQYLAAPAPEF